ncbi:hypothetical protein F5Y16DRAFT_115762 [Xylariaceae sp. FL0255]|nr:hypothetical protein F5Y16DRAFT_115762 [Xylariaceae sp. FL0255]
MSSSSNFKTPLRRTTRLSQLPGSAESNAIVVESDRSTSTSVSSDDTDDRPVIAALRFQWEGTGRYAPGRDKTLKTPTSKAVAQPKAKVSGLIGRSQHETAAPNLKRERISSRVASSSVMNLAKELRPTPNSQTQVSVLKTPLPRNSHSLQSLTSRRPRDSPYTILPNKHGRRTAASTPLATPRRPSDRPGAQQPVPIVPSSRGSRRDPYEIPSDSDSSPDDVVARDPVRKFPQLLPSQQTAHVVSSSEPAIEVMKKKNTSVGPSLQRPIENTRKKVVIDASMRPATSLPNPPLSSSSVHGSIVKHEIKADYRQPKPIAVMLGAYRNASTETTDLPVTRSAQGFRVATQNRDAEPISKTDNQPVQGFRDTTPKKNAGNIPRAAQESRDAPQKRDTEDITRTDLQRAMVCRSRHRKRRRKGKGRKNNKRKIPYIMDLLQTRK